MKEMDCVEVIIEKEKYAKERVHEGMQGWICDPRMIGGTWLVNFPQCGEKRDIATLDIKEEDLELISVMHAILDEQIKARFEEAEKTAKSFDDTSEGLSDYIV